MVIVPGERQCSMGILEKWKLTAEELNEIMAANPSMRGLVFGYVGEYKLRKMWFNDPRITDLRKYDDHDRTKKGDLSFRYGGVEVRVEVRSLQTATVKQVEGRYTARFQCDASDRRKVRLANGETVETKSLG